MLFVCVCVRACVCRLRCLVKQLEKGEVSVSDLKKNLEYAALVLESLYVEQTRSGPSSSVLSLSLHMSCNAVVAPLPSPQFVFRFSTRTPSVFLTLHRQLVDPEDELRNFQSDSVPSEVREWLASTFTRQTVLPVRSSEDKPRFRSIVHAVQASIFVERSGFVPLLHALDQYQPHRDGGRQLCVFAS